jgi:REP element-mobilizing transposase RayT
VARALRIEFDGAWYHVMNRGAGRRRVFESAAHATTFLALLGEISTVYGIEVHAYCLMGNHYHLLLRTPRAGLARAMRHLDGVYTQRFNRSVGTDGPLFRGRYRSVLIGEESHLCCVSRYIHLNPVEAELVARPEAYRDSSYRAYLGLCSGPPWLHFTETLGRFQPGDARENYRRFVMAGIDDDTRVFYAEARRRPVLGSDGFRERIAQRVLAAASHSDPERPDGRLLMLIERPTLDEIAAAVCRAFDVSRADLRFTSRRNFGFSAARGAFVLLGREVGGRPLAEVASWIGYRSYAAASKAMIRLRDEIGRVPGTRDRVESARSGLRMRG